MQTHKSQISLFIPVDNTFIYIKSEITPLN